MSIIYFSFSTHVFFNVNFLVEIDESMFGKRKYNKGTKKNRRLKWVLGGICRETGQVFLEICPGEERSMAVLDELILKHVAIGIWLLNTYLQNILFPFNRHSYLH